MWTAKKITADAASKMQIEAGLLLNTFSIASPTEPQDSAIVCETTGDFSISCKPVMKDEFADVNNAPTDTKEGLRIKGWDCAFSVDCLSITEDTLKLALGAALGTATAGITAKNVLVDEDFKTLYWVGDLMDETSLLVVEMENTLSTGGLAFSAKNDGKGTISLDLKPYKSIATAEAIPMKFYILTKAEA